MPAPGVWPAWTPFSFPADSASEGIEGKIEAVRHARENKVPYLGICLGMQVAVIEFARHRAGLTGADSTEFNRATPHPVIALVTEWVGKDGALERRDEGSELGGTMRLGSQEIRLRRESRMRAVYGAEIIRERHRHRYEFNNTYMDPLQDAGLQIAGKTIDGTLVEVVEVPDHPGSSVASSIRSSNRPRATGTRCSTDSWRRRTNSASAPASPRRERPGRRRSLCVMRNGARSRAVSPRLSLPASLRRVFRACVS